MASTCDFPPPALQDLCPHTAVQPEFHVHLFPKPAPHGVEGWQLHDRESFAKLTVRAAREKSGNNLVDFSFAEPLVKSLALVFFFFLYPVMCLLVLALRQVNVAPL